MKKILLFVGVLTIIILVGFFALKKQFPQFQNRTEKIQVIATIFPLYDMAKNIGGDKAEILLLLPAGAEAHSFEPQPNDIVKINSAALFIYTGKFMEPWAEDILKSANSKNLLAVDSSQNIKMILSISEDADEPAGSFDPHIWLDFDNAKTMVQNIATAFIAQDAANAVFYKQNAENYTNRLTEIDAQYKITLSTCENHEIIYAGHYAFGYLANRYHLQYLAAQGVSPDSEPTAKDLINLVNQIKENNIKYIFYEELSSPKIAETIAQETNAKTLLLNASHNLSKIQREQNVSFFDILNNNLENLKIGLHCQ